MDLTSYAELAVRLVNSAIQANGGPDPLGAVDSLGVLVADRPHLSGQVTAADCAALAMLRTELSGIFAAAATGRDRIVAERLNALLVRCPIQPELVSHDGQSWHVHLAQSGSVADRYAAGAVIGLSLTVSQFGVSRLGTCSIASCQQVFIDASSNRSRRYCAEHGVARANVMTIRAQTRPEHPGRTATAG